MKKYYWQHVLLVLLAMGLLLIFSFDTNAQCSMCRAALSSSKNSNFIRNFNIGVLVLLVPPVSIFCSIFIVLRRHHVGDRDRDNSKTNLD